MTDKPQIPRSQRGNPNTGKRLEAAKESVGLAAQKATAVARLAEAKTAYDKAIERDNEARSIMIADVAEAIESAAHQAVYATAWTLIETGGESMKDDIEGVMHHADRVLMDFGFDYNHPGDADRCPACHGMNTFQYEGAGTHIPITEAERGAYPPHPPR